MKILQATLLWAIGCIPAYALPLGNPAEPNLWGKNACGECSAYPSAPFCGGNHWCEYFHFGFGYYGDFVFNRHLGNDIPAEIAKTKITTNAGYLVLNICNTFDLFSALGGSKIELEGYGSAFGGESSQLGFPPPRKVILESTTQFSWSVGARAAIWECACFGIGAEAQYFRTTPDINYIADMLFSLSYPDDLSMKYSEWQVGLGVYYKIKWSNYFPLFSAVPYAGIKWASVHLDMNNAVIHIPDSVTIDTFNLHDLESRRHVGLVVGTSIIFCERIGVTLEARFRDEIAFFTNAEYRF